MGFFGLVGLLCGRTDSGRRANCYRMTRDVREDPGASDSHLFTDSGHLGKRFAAGAGSGRSLGDHSADAPANGSKKFDDRPGASLLVFLCLRRELEVGPGRRRAPAYARTWSCRRRLVVAAVSSIVGVSGGPRARVCVSAGGPITWSGRVRWAQLYWSLGRSRLQSPDSCRHVSRDRRCAREPASVFA